ncbi:hypothetical protein [Methylobacterium sp. J-070]|uniref:hypothetical protein n=1 Tax=Methylobacterium sp. J-070 TaxID=2836650 RepID=UPI001FBBF0CB|nr:hypothetical protein [Methylobacterium sp. J-070]MCJ2052327.1 hypothetical protein [Methylobacterium sp. J-070]
MSRNPFDIVSDLIEQHVSAEETAPAAISIVAALAVLAAAGSAHAPAAHVAARRRLKDAATWFDGRPAEVAALIDDLGAMDPLNRDRRKAVLTAAWADLLVE